MNECPLKRDHVQMKAVFQPSFFQGHVSFGGCKTSLNQKGSFVNFRSFFFAKDLWLATLLNAAIKEAFFETQFGEPRG